MMNKYLEDVKEFHETFNHPVEETIKTDNLKLRQLRLKLIFEELEELSSAMDTDVTLYNLCKDNIDKFLLSKKVNDGDNVDKVESLDALCDIQYVLSGAILSLGYTNVFDEAFSEVQRSNMSKMCLDEIQADDTIKYYKEERQEQLEMTPVEKDGKYIVVRSDGKIMKNVHYSPADLTTFVK